MQNETFPGHNQVGGNGADGGKSNEWVGRQTRDLISDAEFKQFWWVLTSAVTLCPSSRP